MSDSPWIRSTTDATFAKDVYEPSHERPIVVDFWASWCQPCLALKPVLEKLASEYEGKFLLVKAETEHNQQAAGELNVSGIPAVFGVAGGAVVDGFTGAVPEHFLRGWLDRLLTTAQLQQAESLIATDPVAAEQSYRAVIEKMPREPQPQIGLGQALLAQGKHEEARQIVTQLEARGFLEPEAQALCSQINLASHSQDNLAELQAAAVADPHNLSRQLELAAALAGAGQHEAALQQALTIIAAEKTGPGDDARKLMLDIFRALPADSDLTGIYRRKLASLLY